MLSLPDLHNALQQIRFARWYTTELVSDIPLERWFEMPAGAATHVAWQVGHLASAEYWLGLSRIRGQQPADEGLISTALRQMFGRGSLPNADPAAYPSAAEIRAVFDRVHERLLAESSSFDPVHLDEPCERPHRIANTRLRSLLWCSQHELIHAGQVGLLRRLLGLQPQW
jgi:uncharacterized damage-inducible protein DinB